MTRSQVMIFLVLFPVPMIPGCNTTQKGSWICGAINGYHCKVYNTGPINPVDLGKTICATSQQQAEQIAVDQAIYCLQPGEKATSAVCTLYSPGAPGPTPQSPPTCVVTSADNACVACAKANCCAEFQSC